ncbi:TniQ family protein [Streptomyces sp. NPDC057686]|uniref:TniQ family protein n=1 Tax=Streptomyces sp. NPDC057686 TaxID=3346212 RepID=UPI0036C5A5E9
MSHRPLARSLAPLPEESLPGFLLRLSYRLELSPARIAKLCGFSTPHRRLPAAYLLALPSPIAGPFAEATRLSAAETQALTLTGSGLAARYAPLYATHLDRGRNHAAAQQRWAVNLSSRFCSLCLAGDGSPVQNQFGGPWKLRWHLPVAFACTTHALPLSGPCPQCRNLPNRSPGTERSGLLIQRAVRGLHPAQCRQPLPGTRSMMADTPHSCGARFDQLPGTAPKLGPGDLDRVLALQLRIDQWLFADESGQTANPHYFRDLVTLAHLIKFSWPLGADLVHSAPLVSLIDAHAAPIARQLGQPLGPGPRPASPWRAPDDPAQCAALLVAADELLSHRDEGDGEYRRRVQPLARLAFEHLTPNLAAALRRMNFSPTLARALARKTNGFYHAGGHPRSRLRTPSRDCQFGVEHVPALLPTAWWDLHFGDLRERMGPLTDWNTRHLRRAASLKLAEMTAGGAWSACAEALDIPWSTAQQSLNILKRVLEPAQSWTEFDQAVTRTAHHLDSRTSRIDYAHRRRTLLLWSVSDATWRELRAGFTTLKAAPTSPSPTAATALVWAHVTQGDYLHSPALTALRTSGRDTTAVVASVNQLRAAPRRTKGEKALLAGRLELYATHLAQACDQAHHIALMTGTPRDDGVTQGGAPCAS